MKKKKTRKPDAVDKIAADYGWMLDREQKRAFASRIRRIINAAVRADRKERTR